MEEALKSKIEDLKKRAANKSLPASAKNEIKKMISELEAQMPKKEEAKIEPDEAKKKKSESAKVKGKKVKPSKKNKASKPQSDDCDTLEKLDTKAKTAGYDLNELLSEAKQRKERARMAAEKRKQAPKKSPATKNKEAIEKTSEKVVKNVAKRSEKGDASRAEVEKLIAKYEQAIKELKAILSKLGKKEMGGEVHYAKGGKTPKLTKEGKVIHKDAMVESNWGGKKDERFFDLSKEQINMLISDGSIEEGHWVLSKINDTEYEAVRDGLYMELFSNLEDMLSRRNQTAFYEYNGELSEENDEETFVDENGKVREYAKGGKLSKYKYVPNRSIEAIEVTKGSKSMEIDGADVLDGVYVKKGKFAEGGKTGKKYILMGYSADASEDSYEEGELDSVGSWDEKMSKEFKSKEELVKYISDKIIYVDYGVEHFDWEIGEGKNIQTDVLCAYDDYNGYFPASENEIELWKKGKKKLYNVHYFFYVMAVIPTDYAKGGGVGEYYSVRNDILKKGLSVPVGDEYVSKGEWKGRWSNDDEKFEIFYKGKWQEAESIDFEESKQYAKGGVVRDYKGLSDSDKFIADQLYYVISVKSISEKKKIIRESLLPNIDDYVTDEMTNKITKDNLKYALQQKKALSIDRVLKGAINAFRNDEFAKGGKTSKLEYRISEMPAFNQYNQRVGSWYRIYDNKGRLKTLFMKKWLNSDEKYSVTEVSSREIAEKILSDIKSGKHNEDRVLSGEKEYAKGGKLSKYKYVPNRSIEAIEVTKGSKSMEIDGADVLDGVYVKKGKYLDGGDI